VGGANELIRPGKGIGRVVLGMTEAHVRRALGTPQAVIAGASASAASQSNGSSDGGAWRVRLVGRRGSLRVASVATIARRERTREGHGVGTLERTLRARYGRVLRCDRLRSDGGYVWGRNNLRNCSLRGPGGTRLVWTSASQRETGDITRVAEWLREARVIEVAVVAAGV
jgi:hypothetical protein